MFDDFQTRGSFDELGYIVAFNVATFVIGALNERLVLDKVTLFVPAVTINLTSEEALLTGLNAKIKNG